MTGTVTATVVFTDLVGSTELASRLGPVEAESLRQDHFSSLREAIVGAGGTEVKNLGDGLMAVFPSLGAGVDAAVAMQQAVDRHNRDHTVGTDIAIRVGMSTGDAVEEDGDYFGEPVVEAARLCARAGPGQILATDLVRVLCRRGPHEFEAMGDLELKGLPEPVTTWAVCWTPAALEPEVPLPARLGVADDVVVGRQEELAVLDGCLKDAAAGGRRVVLLAGEPGMGKTTLAATFACAAHEQGAAVLYGRCDEDLGVPYQPFLEAFGGFVDAAPEAVLQAHVDAYGGELQRLAPSLARRLPDVPPAQPTDPETERYLLFGAAVGLLSTIATRSPVVLVLDDLHWADKPTLLLVRHVVAAPALHGAVVVATYRDSDLSSDHPLVDVLAALRREPAVERVSLRGLGDDEVVELLEALAGHEMGEEGVALAHALVRETSGNPFFTREIVIHLAETGAIQQDESGRWVPAPGFEPSDLPESVREVVGRRIARLGDDTRRILGAAAVIGRDFDLALLAGVVGTDEDEVLDILDRAVTAGLVREAAGPADRFTFTHALVQHTLHNDLGATRRRRLHRKVAEVLEAVCGDDPGERVGELAAHWLAATAPVETTKGMYYAELAGHRALAQLAPDEAVRWFSSALDLLEAATAPDDAQRCGLLVALGVAQRQAGDAAFRRTLLDAASAAVDLGDPERLVDSALANNRGFVSAIGQVDEERIAVLEQALAAIGPGDRTERALLLATLATELTYAGDLPRRQALVEEAIAVARRVADPASLVRVLTLSAESTRVPGTVEERRALLAEARETADATGDPSGRYWASFISSIPAMETARLDEFDRHNGVALAIASQLGQPGLRWNAEFQRDCRTFLLGDADRAEASILETFQLGSDAGEPDAMAIFGAQLAAVRWQQGRMAELAPLVEQTVVENPGLADFLSMLALGHLDVGDEPRARAMFEQRLSEGFELEADDYVWLSGLVMWAEVAVRLGHRAGCERLAACLAPWSGQLAMTGATCYGPVACTVAALERVCGRLDAAERLLAEAAASCEALGAPFFLARTELERALLLADRGRPEEAAPVAEAARSRAAARGCAALERRAADLLASLR